MKPICSVNKARDWHQADIIAALCKAGWSLRKLSIHHGYHPSVLATALRRPYLAAELLIAEALGVSAAVIWPTRYPRCGEKRSLKREAVFSCAYPAWSPHDE